MTRLRIAFAALRGRPVMYRMHAVNGVLVFPPGVHALIADCLFEIDVPAKALDGLAPR